MKNRGLQMTIYQSNIYGLRVTNDNLSIKHIRLTSYISQRRVGNVFWLPTNMILMVNGMVGKQKHVCPPYPAYKLHQPA